MLWAGLACGRKGSSVDAPRRDSPIAPQSLERVRLIVMGDTGLPGPEMETLNKTLQTEAAEYVLVLGDLVYETGPACPDGRAKGEALRILDERLYGTIGKLERPTLLALGNHDLAHRPKDAAREACYLDYASQHANLIFPDLFYTVELGVVTLVVLNTNQLTSEQATTVQAAFEESKGWKILAGHHVLKTYHDKESEDLLHPWFQKHGLAPDFYFGGHAHFQQFGRYAGIFALTSGSTAKIRTRPSCPPTCGPGQMWGQSTRGYALVDATPDNVSITFKGIDGTPLWHWSSRGGAQPSGVNTK